MELVLYHLVIQAHEDIVIRLLPTQGPWGRRRLPFCDPQFFSYYEWITDNECVYMAVTNQVSMEEEIVCNRWKLRLIMFHDLMVDDQPLHDGHGLVSKEEILSLAMAIPSSSSSILLSVSSWKCCCWYRSQPCDVMVRLGTTCNRFLRNSLP